MQNENQSDAGAQYSAYWQIDFDEFRLDQLPANFSPTREMFGHFGH